MWENTHGKVVARDLHTSNAFTCLTEANANAYRVNRKPTANLQSELAQTRERSLRPTGNRLPMWYRRLLEGESFLRILLLDENYHYIITA